MLTDDSLEQQRSIPCLNKMFICCNGICQTLLLHDNKGNTVSSCGLELNRDHNAAINIKQLAVGHPVKAEKLNARSRKQKREAERVCGE